MSKMRIMDLCKSCTKTEKEHKTLICTPRGKPCMVHVSEVGADCVNYGDPLIVLTNKAGDVFARKAESSFDIPTGSENKIN